MLESALERRFLKGVRARGGMTIKLVPVHAGTPDRLVLYKGQLHLVELKTDTGRLSPIQVHWHGLAAGQGVTVVVLRGAEEIDEWIGAL
jgi:23S rRNA-/tRNA-specific pseudouridylate synthase